MARKTAAVAPAGIPATVENPRTRRQRKAAKNAEVKMAANSANRATRRNETSQLKKQQAADRETIRLQNEKIALLEEALAESKAAVAKKDEEVRVSKQSVVKILEDLREISKRESESLNAFKAELRGTLMARGDEDKRGE